MVLARPDWGACTDCTAMQERVGTLGNELALGAMTCMHWIDSNVIRVRYTIRQHYLNHVPSKLSIHCHRCNHTTLHNHTNPNPPPRVCHQIQAGKSCGYSSSTGGTDSTSSCSSRETTAAYAGAWPSVRPRSRIDCIRGCGRRNQCPSPPGRWVRSCIVASKRRCP